MRRLAVAAAVTLACAPASVPPIASAQVAGCVGVAAPLQLSQGLYYPVVGPTVQTSGYVVTNVGPACSASITLTSANCGNSVGYGTLVDSNGGLHTFSLVTAGTVAVLSGGVNGTVHMIPAPGESCLPGRGGGADTFLTNWECVGTPSLVVCV